MTTAQQAVLTLVIQLAEALEKDLAGSGPSVSDAALQGAIAQGVSELARLKALQTPAVEDPA